MFVLFHNLPLIKFKIDIRGEIKSLCVSIRFVNNFKLAILFYVIFMFVLNRISVWFIDLHIMHHHFRLIESQVFSHHQ